MSLSWYNFLDLCPHIWMQPDDQFVVSGPIRYPSYSFCHCGGHVILAGIIRTFDRFPQHTAHGTCCVGRHHKDGCPVWGWYSTPVDRTSSLALQQQSHHIRDHLACTKCLILHLLHSTYSQQLSPHRPVLFQRWRGRWSSPSECRPALHWMGQEVPGDPGGPIMPGSPFIPSVPSLPGAPVAPATPSRPSRPLIQPHCWPVMYTYEAICFYCARNIEKQVYQAVNTACPNCNHIRRNTMQVLSSTCVKPLCLFIMYIHVHVHTELESPVYQA